MHVHVDAVDREAQEKATQANVRAQKVPDGVAKTLAQRDYCVQLMCMRMHAYRMGTGTHRNTRPHRHTESCSDLAGRQAGRQAGAHAAICDNSLHSAAIMQLLITCSANGSRKCASCRVQTAHTSTHAYVCVHAREGAGRWRMAYMMMLQSSPKGQQCATCMWQCAHIYVHTTTLLQQGEGPLA